MNRKSKKDAPDLVKLRPWCGVFLPYEEEGSDGFHQICTGHSIKVYGARKGRWVYQGAVLEPRDEVRPIEELRTLVDKRPLDELWDEGESALKQLLARAHCGDDEAIKKLVLLVRGAVGSLQMLSKEQADKVKAVAETLPAWPVLLSLNPQDIKAAKNNLKALGVGTKAPTPTKPGQRIDRHNNPWTRLAEKAFEACRINRTLARWHQAHGKGAQKERVFTNFWRTEATADCFTLGSGDQIILTRRVKDCGRLPDPSPPMSKATFLKWWAVVNACLLHHWKSCPEKYAEALRRIGQSHKEEYFRRNLAVTQVRQRFESLVGLRQ